MHAAKRRGMWPDTAAAAPHRVILSALTPPLSASSPPMMMSRLNSYVARLVSAIRMSTCVCGAQRRQGDRGAQVECARPRRMANAPCRAVLAQV